MNNSVLSRLCAILVIICIAFSTLTTALAVENTGSEGGESASSVASSEAVSSNDGAESESASQSSTDAQVSSVASSVEGTVTSDIVSSDDSIASQVESNNQTVSSVVSELKEDNKDQDVTESKDTSSKKGNSSKKNNSSKKGNSSKKNNSKTNGEGNSSANNIYSQYTPSYNSGSLSEDWEQGSDVELVSSEEAKELSDHIFDPKEAVTKWIWLPILVALICIGILIYVNVYVYNSGAHSGGTRKKNGDTDPDEDALDEESIINPDMEDDSDPFSAENFFNFDNDNE